MDPNANLKEQLDLANGIMKVWDDGAYPAPEDAARLSELVVALDEWIRKGGILPEHWIYSK